MKIVFYISWCYLQTTCNIKNL